MKKVCEGTDRELKLTVRNKVLFFRKGLSIIDYRKMLDIQESICHGKVINALIKSNMGVQPDSMGINITVEKFLGGTWIISKEDYSGEMVIQLGFYLSMGSHIDTT